MDEQYSECMEKYEKSGHNILIGVDKDGGGGRASCREERQALVLSEKSLPSPNQPWYGDARYGMVRFGK